MAYLKQQDTGEIFPVNEHLIARGDMILCDIHGNPVAEPVAEAPAVPEPSKPARKPRAKKEPAPPPVVEEPSADGLDLGFDLDLDLGDD